jgi:hypothetical protein
MSALVCILFFVPLLAGANNTSNHRRLTCRLETMLFIFAVASTSRIASFRPFACSQLAAAAAGSILGWVGGTVAVLCAP